MPDRLTRIVLFTRDLRVHDNPVLAAAAESDAVLPVFVRDDRIAATGFSGASRQRFLDAGLADLDRALRRLGAGLLIRTGDPATEVARLAERYDAASVHIAADVSGYSIRRRERLERALAAGRRRLVEHQSVTTIQPPGAVTPVGADHFSVFTPYYRRWAEVPRRPVLPAPDRLRLPDGVEPDPVPDVDAVQGWRGGETEARSRANAWFLDGLASYEDRHDDLSADATSHLSPYLHLGQLSPSELATRAAERPSRGSVAFVRQLAWRDFHAQVLAARPKVAWQDYRPRGDRWSDPDPKLDAWRVGATGYPLVDAGIRQMLATGWMHNRARLVVGSFLAKTLYLDWRLGARHFLDHLLDGDLANNNLNWQWVAGTGTDTKPSRVLNPTRQAERYDPTGDYIRRWVPELAGLADAADVHQPWRLPENRRRPLGYPDPIVDLAEGRARFLAGRDAR